MKVTKANTHSSNTTEDFSVFSLIFQSSQCLSGVKPVAHRIVLTLLPFMEGLKLKGSSDRRKGACSYPLGYFPVVWMMTWSLIYDCYIIYVVVWVDNHVLTTGNNVLRFICHWSVLILVLVWGLRTCCQSCQDSQLLSVNTYLCPYCNP